MSRKATLTLAALIFLATAAVFGPIVGHPFITIDDPQYISENPQVRAGLSPASIAWAFTTFDAVNWHPLTWLSHELDVTLFGLDPRGHHLTSVALHATTSALIFLVLTSATGAAWPSFWTTLFFAVHPLRVESVAWAAERKDVLSLFFAALTLAAYLRHARRPAAGRWAAMVLLFALGLMAKPMLVSLPFVLLLLDYWPLGRLRDLRSLSRLVTEKAPLFILAALSSAVTLQAQAVAVVPRLVIPLRERLANAVVSAVTYLGATLRPASLSFYYPWPEGGPSSATAAAVLLVAGSLIALAAARRHPYLVTGWCWYLVTLLPVLGLVQVGIQARADRYTYLPSLGFLLATVWLLRDFGRRRGPRHRFALAAGGAGLALLSAAATVVQVAVWRDGETLFRHALSATGENWLARFGLGVELARAGRIGEARAEFQRVVTVKPNLVEGHYNLALALEELGDVASAEREYRETLRGAPDYAEARNSLGTILLVGGAARRDRVLEAAAHLRRATSLRPAWATARFNLARALRLAGDAPGAVREYREGLRFEPGNAQAHNNLGILLAEAGELAGAIVEFRAALGIDPGFVGARRNLERAGALDAGR